ncbi:DUF1381 domain-containing protein [Staphylococcus pseudoxylosus]|uniref:DUF1381 domain-containing protein n=1 Tax=Staphylococcus pseudoxylosus TaxID=2282419 RepID=UPI002DBE2866|nr:DUF1381 domain-containing protein [Staphylococcus pseudoxylosus]MEB6037971.1 DUF1381 domain-containing protein [Staphylococcus pseudoxylosus]MEB8099177.1 DUF1381 domain-containing protein [Staphylococcus xylosus]
MRTLTDSTGHPFTHVTQARENETFTVIEAESKEEALKRYRFNKAINNINKAFKNNKLLQAIRKDSE